jgi:HEAT repeat protein
LVNAAIDALGVLGDPEAVEVLEAAVPRHHNACVALGKIGGSKAEEALIRCLDGDDRSEAARALGGLGSLAAVPSLVEALGGADLSGARSAAEALGKIGDRQAVAPLASALAGVGACAVEALKRLNATQELIAALGTGTCKWNREVVRALGELGDSAAIGPLVAAFPSEPKESAIALGRLGAFGELRSMILARPEGSSATCAVEGLGYLGGKQEERQEVIALLGKLVRKPNNELASAALTSLGRLADPSGISTILDALERGLDRADLSSTPLAPWDRPHLGEELAQVRKELAFLGWSVPQNEEEERKQRNLRSTAKWALERIIERSAGGVADETLRHVSQLSNHYGSISRLVRYGMSLPAGTTLGGGTYVTERNWGRTLDCSGLRAAAAAELSRRKRISESGS